MRKIWLQKPNSQDTWDLLPQDKNLHYISPKNNEPNSSGEYEYWGSLFANIRGMGYKQDITQTQVNTEYYVSKVLSKNQSITGILYFENDDHIKSFQKFVGDFRNQLLLYYSPNGEFAPNDQLSAPYYKKVIISIVDKGEMDEMGWYLVSMELSTQDDVWNRNLYYAIEELSSVGSALVYPYTYPYEIGGRNALAIDFNNDGREVGCEIRIKNRGDGILRNIEWYIDRTYIDYYGVLHEHEEVQRAKWNVDLSPNSELVVNSNPLTQEAKIIYGDNTAQSVVDTQEPSWDYINFIQIPQGQNRIVFYIENEDIDIKVIYREQKELI